MLTIDIYNVGANSCASMSWKDSDENDRLFVLDCGYGQTGWYPSTHFMMRTIDTLFITNYDEDHARDFEDLLKFATVKTIARNTNVSPDVIKLLKSDSGMGAGIEALVAWAKKASAPAGAAPNYAPLKYQTFSNSYDKYCINGFDDENNLSMAVVVEYYGFKILFPGDLEKDGMSALLQRADFLKAIQGINVLIAPHHGRENGCSDDLFKALAAPPKLVIMSDKSIIHGTQEDTASWYGNRIPEGANVVDAQGKRKVITTRNDGHVRLTVDKQGAWRVYTGVKHG